jgi:hypothetical protein
MGNHIMKTTIEIADPLLRKAKTLARRQGTTLRALVESGLRKVLDDAQTSSFRLEDRSVGGDGLFEGLDYSAWAKILERAYEERG